MDMKFHDHLFAMCGGSYLVGNLTKVRVKANRFFPVHLEPKELFVIQQIQRLSLSRKFKIKS